MEINKLHQLFLNSSGVTTDTRAIKTNQIFFALKGDNFNGNTFAWQAIKKGASHAVIDEEKYASDNNYIVVKDVLKTLQQLAAYHRKHLNIPILAITGSNGKTTSKEIISGILRKKFEVVATVGNLNNHIGVPLTLLSMKATTQFGIVEMGANNHGEIANLCTIASPEFGYITNFGKAHLEGFGSVQGVIKAKSEMYDYLKKHKKLLFLNADDPVQQKHLDYEHIFTFGASNNADVRVMYPEETTTATVIEGNKTFGSLLTGSYNAVNIAAGICIGHYFKVQAENIQKAIAAYSPKNNRSQIIKSGSTTILMDAYNANPTSMKAALDSFKNYPANKRILILGDMFELGKDAEVEHQEIVNEILRHEGLYYRIFLVGTNFYKTEVSNQKIVKCEDFESLKAPIKKIDKGNTHILIKGSRGMALERILEVIDIKEKA